jgi:hypothetical protein
MGDEQHGGDVPIFEMLEYRGPQLRETSADGDLTSAEKLNSLAHTAPDVVAAVLADWIDARPGMPR